MLKRSISVLLVVVMMLAVLVVAAPIAQARNVGGTLTETSASAYSKKGDVIYYDNSQTKFKKVYCFMWYDTRSGSVSNAKWPGKAMTYLGNNLWSYKITGSYNWVIFTDYNGGDGLRQTDDLAYPGNNKIAKAYKTKPYTGRAWRGLTIKVKWATKTTAVKTPVIGKLENTTTGVKATWGKVAGAAKYRLFRKKGSQWLKVGDTTGVSLIDKKAVSGSTYVYTVRAMNAKGAFVSSYNTKGWKILFVAAPALSAVKNTANGVSVAWKASKGAAKYRVFRKIGTGSWTKLADTAGTSYVDKTAQNGKTYSYTVRAMNAKGAFVSAYNTTGKSIKCVR